VADRHGAAHVQFTPLPHAVVWRVDEGESHGDAQAPPAGSRGRGNAERPVPEGLGTGRRACPAGFTAPVWYQDPRCLLCTDREEDPPCAIADSWPPGAPNVRA
jgi:hypothetical protein